MGNLGRLGMGNRGGGESYDAATIAYLAEMTTKPTAAQAAAINARIVAIRARAGLWE
jgi:hypothetical protein